MCLTHGVHLWLETHNNTDSLELFKECSGHVESVSQLIVGLSGTYLLIGFGCGVVAFRNPSSGWEAAFC